ncbi:flap endonuclease GEN homolog 1-like [Saccostrea cucullata]|uniref:flap endonuclease GEN homolog 1-like n=1 Tax=Saccostrea cuccullata TaxID=36930 RepID=UPI002ED0FC8E
MGVKDLWKVLSPVAQKSVPVKSLAGKTLAVDLSGWIVEFRSNQTVPHLYLRTLYQRTTRLMKAGVKLVFIADGVAPECKRDTILARNKDGFASSKPHRQWFNSITEKCFAVLECLGLPCVQAPGEAEAYCAWLNNTGKVDGILTEDADAFLYGGKVVYKNLHALNKHEYLVDVYDIRDTENKLELTRETLVAMAMLVGFDYDKGLRDIGIEKAQELFREMACNQQDPLTRITGWRTNKELERLSTSTEKREAHCKQCQHKGTKNQHEKEGCTDCNLKISCDQSSKVKCSCGGVFHEKEKHRLELRCYQKAIKNHSFPNKKVVDEFLHSTDNLTETSFEWKRIDINKLKNQVPWVRYEDIAELLVQLKMIGLSCFTDAESIIRPLRILNKCQQNFVKCFEVQWTKLDVDSQSQGDCYTFIVDQEPFKRLYKNVVVQYQTEVEEENKRKERERQIKRGKKRQATGTLDGKSTLMTDYFKVKKKSSPPPPEVE